MKKDLAILVADRNMQAGVDGILHRPQALGIRAVDWRIIRHSGRDGGTRDSGPELLAMLRRECSHGIVMLDWEGSGSDAKSPEALQSELQVRVDRDWGVGKGLAVVIVPELEAWIWGQDNAMRQFIKWDNPGGLAIRDWLRSRGFVFRSDHKPERPKEALEAILVQVNMPRSSALFEQAASRLSLDKCVDPAFVRLRDALRGWFRLRS